MSIYREDLPPLELDYGDWREGFAFLIALAAQRFRQEEISVCDFEAEKNLMLLFNLKIAKLGGYVLRPYGKYHFMLWDKKGHQAYSGHDSQSWTPVLEWWQLRDKVPDYCRDANLILFRCRDLCRERKLELSISCKEGLWEAYIVTGIRDSPYLIGRVDTRISSYSLALALGFLMLDQGEKLAKQQ